MLEKVGSLKKVEKLAESSAEEPLFELTFNALTGQYTPNNFVNRTSLYVIEEGDPYKREEIKATIDFEKYLEKKNNSS